MIGGLTKEDKAAEARKTSNQPREVLVAEHVVNAINDLQKLHDRLCSPQGNDCVNDIQKFTQDGGGLCEFQLLQSYINCVEEDEPSIEKLTIMKFLRSIIEDKELYVKLYIFNFNYLHPDFDGIPGSIDYEEIRSQLSRIVTDCKLENLEDKIRLLALLREKMNFADIQKAYDNWRFSDLIGDNDFKRMYMDQAVKEREKPVSEDFEKNIGKYIKLVEEGKEVASRYFGKWKVNFQAYCEEIDNNNRVVNVNLINYDKSKPIRISDILQQEKNVGKLNICCNKKHEIYAHQEDKKRYYEFKEGACYEMTSTWPVKDEFGNVSICTMIMNVSSDGITEVLKFDGEDFVPSKEILELIKQNDELYIQGLSLYDAVMKSLEKSKAVAPLDVIPTVNNNFQNESIAAYQDKEPEGKLDPKVDDDNSLHPSPSINSNASTQTEVASQQMDELILNNQMLSEENVELKQEMSNLKKEAVELKEGKSDLEDKLKGVNTEKKELEDKLKEFEKEIDQAAHIMKEKEQSISNLKYQMLEYKAQLESYEQEICNLAWRVEELRSELERENGWDDKVVEMLDRLKEKIHADGQRSLNDQLYTLTGDISSEPDNAPRKKIELSRSLSFDSESDNESYVPQNPQKKKKKLLRCSSFDSEFSKSYVPQEGDNDSAYDSNEENCDNGLSSNISPISSIKKVAERVKTQVA